MSEDMEPIPNDDWFDIHIIPKINEITFQSSGMYFVNVGLCWNRHRYTDDYDGRVAFSVFPRTVLFPQDWTAHWSHSIRFLTALHNKLKSFNQEFARVDLRVYFSGAPGCRKAITDAFNDNVKRIGKPGFVTPFTWRLIPMHRNTQTMKYEEKPDIFSYPPE